MSKSNSKKKRPAPNPVVVARVEAERRAAMVKHTADLKLRAKEEMPTVIFCVSAYIIFSALLLHDAKVHRGTPRADDDWLMWILISAGLFGIFMVRKVLRWDGRIKF